MITHLVLLGLVLGLVVLLELLNAYYERLADQHDLAMAESFEKEPSSALSYYARLGVSRFYRGASAVSLYFHELMHAVGQAVCGMKPRIVICRNGGYAEAKTWGPPPLRIYAFFSTTLLRGVICMAPLLGGSLLLYVTARYLVPLDAGTLGELAHGMVDAEGAKATVQALGTATGELWRGVFGAPLWATFLFILVGLLLGFGLTPSSSDFFNAFFHLLAYTAAYLMAASLFLHMRSPRGVLLGAGAATLVLGLVSVTRTGDPTSRAFRFLGGFGTTCLLLAALSFTPLLGDTPQRSLASALATLAVLLAFAGSLYVLFIAVLFVLGLFHRPSNAFVERMRPPNPEALNFFEALVSDFTTCTQCQVHVRKRCEVCGRSAEEIRRDPDGTLGQQKSLSEHVTHHREEADDTAGLAATAQARLGHTEAPEQPASSGLAATAQAHIEEPVSQPEVPSSGFAAQMKAQLEDAEPHEKPSASGLAATARARLDEAKSETPTSGGLLGHLQGRKTPSEDD